MFRIQFYQGNLISLLHNILISICSYLNVGINNWRTHTLDFLTKPEQFVRTSICASKKAHWISISFEGKQSMIANKKIDKIKQIKKLGSRLILELR
jgi:hypothetical protein